VQANIFTRRFDEDFRGLAKRARVGRHAGTEQIGLSVYELAPKCPRDVSKYHLQHANEELRIVLSGTPTVTTPSDQGGVRRSAPIHGARIRLQKAKSGLQSGGGGIRTHEGPEGP
jgi:uncharacterized cupin superfamily protein